MCGIAYTSFVAGDLSSVMRRRGMDGYARRQVEGGELHHALLAINGWQEQPIVTGEHATVYNGEIYNLEEVGGRPKQDAVIMAEGFADSGADFLRCLNGDWALVQTCGQEVAVVRGRFGLRPLFRYYDGEYLIYASNIATIELALRRLGKQLCINAAYPPKGRIPIPSCYIHVESLPPGIIEKAEKLSSGWHFKRERWYHPKAVDHGPLDDVLLDAVQCRLHECGAVAVSGGVDSYLLQTYAKTTPLYHLDITGEADQARSLGAKILDPPKVEARDLATVLEQPFYAAPPNFFLAKAIKAQDPTVRVVLTGIGADELFGGYRHHERPYSDRKEEAYRKVYGIAPPAGCADWRSAELEHSIPHHYGYRTDQMFLWHGIEVRHPYLDHRVVETALCTPPDGKRQLRALACAYGWSDQEKKGFAADLDRLISS